MITKSRFVLPLSALLVAALIGGLTWVLTSGSSTPPTLRLLGTGSTARDMAAPAATGEAGTTGSGGYRLTGELPEGRPADSPVYPLAGPYDTTRLARALTKAGLTTDHAAWSWSSYCTTPALGAPDQPTSDASSAPEQGKSVDGCAVSSGSGVSGSSGSGGGTASSGTVTAEPAPPPASEPVSEPAPEPTADPAVKPSAEPVPPDSRPVPAPSPEPTTPAMTETQARAAAAPVFEAVDLPVADARVTVTPYGASVWLDPVVRGLRTAGYTTRVELSKDREITWASGFLGTPEAGDSYPLLTAKEAFDAIESGPVTDMMCRVGPEGKGCLAPPEPEITGAELGLQLRQTGKGEQVLVPAWLFTVKGWTEPLPQIAIPTSYLGEPETPTPAVRKDDGATEPAPMPGSVEPAPPTKP